MPIAYCDNHSFSLPGAITAFAVSALIKLLNGEDVSEQKISTDLKSNDETTRTLLKIVERPIKNEDGTPAKSGNSRRSTPLTQFRTVSSVSQITKSGLYSIFQPQPLPYIDVENNCEHTYMELEPEYQTNIMVKVIELPQLLIRTAMEQDKVLVGCVNFAMPGNNLNGHTIAFCATKHEIFFIDGQEYNGIKDTGEPVFTSLENTYKFATLIAGQDKGEYADDCFYRILSSVNAEVLNSSHKSSPK